MASDLPIWLGVYTAIITGLAFAHFGSPPEDRLSRPRLTVLTIGILSIPLLLLYSIQTSTEHFLVRQGTDVFLLILIGLSLGGVSIALYEVLKGDLPDEENASVR